MKMLDIIRNFQHYLEELFHSFKLLFVYLFRDRGTGVSAIAHFDEFTKRVHFERMATAFLEKIR